MSSEVGVSTEGIDPTAVLARRAGAWFIDVVFCVLAGAVPALLLADAYSLNRPSGRPSLEWHDGDLGIFVRDTVIVLHQTELAITLGALAAGVLLLVVVLPGRRGWSPGRLAADLRLVDRDGERAGVGRALLRTVLWIIDALPGLPLVAYVVARRTRYHQRVGDLVARTYVVDKRADGLPVGVHLATDGLSFEPVATEPEPTPEPEPVAAPRPDPEPAAPRAAPPEGVPLDEPIWDRRHRRYVLWHSKAGRWLEHTDDGGWQPLDG